MAVARVAGQDFDFTPEGVDRALARVEPEPIQEHYVIVAGRRYPPKQVLAAATGLDRADFTTHQARAILRRLGFGAYRRGGENHHENHQGTAPTGVGPRQGAEAVALEPYRGRWVAQEGIEVLFDADSPEEVVRWLRRHRRTARVRRIPASAVDTGSSLSAP